jgi:hypothetical protein
MPFTTMLLSATRNQSQGENWTHVHFHQIPILTQLDPEVLVELIEIHLQFCLAHLGTLGSMCRIVVDVGEENGLGELGFDVFARTAVAMSTGSDFQVERAIHTVLLGTAESISHCERTA